jgi:quinol monooxygenase YgiN
MTVGDLPMSVHMIIVAGYAKVDPSETEKAIPIMQAMMAATRREKGCLAYDMSFDILERGIIRIYERWEDEFALRKHFATGHMAAFQKALSGMKVLGLEIKAYDVTGARELPR